MKILIVDDNQDDRTLLRYVVEKNGHLAIEAANGLEALEKARSQPPDLILSDALMPVMDGFRLLRTAKQDPALRAIPFIFYSSSYRGDQDVRLAMSLGAQAYIVKPVDPVELWGRIEGILRSGEPAQAEPALPIQQDEEYLKRYCEVVATQLDEKVRELERTLEERDHAEKTLRKISRAVEQSPVSIIITDAAGNIEYVNPKFTEVTGYTPPEIQGRNPRILKSGKTPAEDYRNLWQTITSGKEWRGELINRRKNGNHYRESVCISPVFDTGGSITHFVAVKEDITEFRALEEELRLAQKLEAVGQLAAGVAHDFNNVLAAILLNLSLLVFEDGPRLSKDTRARLQELENEAHLAAGLTRQLLLFSRREILDARPVDLTPQIHGLSKMLKRLIGEDVDLFLQVQSEALWLMADAGMMDQVLMNLCVNARDAMPRGGQITLGARRVEIDAEQAGKTPGARPGPFVCLTVADSGCGMDEDTCSHIFEPFFTTKEVGKGTGLGLATVYGIVKQHEGWIHVSSALGRGTTFEIYLPALRQAPQPATSDIDRPPVRGGSETLLLVEDNPTLRRLEAVGLRRFGYVVWEASNAKETLQLWREHQDRIALLLTDAVLPGALTGVDLAERLLQQKQTLKVIVTSGYGSERSGPEKLAALGITYLAKPFEIEALAATVRSCLDANGP